MARLLLGWLVLSSYQLVAAEVPHPGTEVNLVPFGRVTSWEGSPGVEWDEPRNVRRVEVNFTDSGRVPSAAALGIEYWVSSWPPVARGGWTKTDTPWQGHWCKVKASGEVHTGSVVFRFAPLSEAENADARNTPGFAPSFRQTLKIRVRFRGKLSGYTGLSIYGKSRWNVRDINVQSGCEGKRSAKLSVSAYNGQILRSTPFEAEEASLRLRVLYTEHDPASADRTILTVRGGEYTFGVSVDDVIDRKGVYVEPLGIFLGDAAAGEEFAVFRESGTIRRGEDIISRTSHHAEQSLANALGEIPRLSVTARSGSHAFRFIPLGFTANREKYGLDFNGNIFISKHSSKAMKEDLDRMLWEGDEIYFRIGTGLAPDFRERATGTRQELAENGLPLVTTSWHNQGIDYEEQAYATLLEAPLDDAHLRGDEPSLLFLRLGATNPGPSPVQAQLWFHVSPPQDLQLKDRMLFGTGGRPSDYGQRPLRAGFEAADGVLQIRAAPHTGFSDNYLANSIEERVTSVNGQAVLWSVAVPAHQTKVLDIKVPFRAVFSATEQDHFKRIRFESRLDETLMYWKRRIGTAGMQIRLPDEILNSFYVAVLQHVLVSEERDVGTGYTMCPCGTYDYNMFANETDIQVRLLDMRGLHADAWRCLRPLVELQGSKPLPGRFRNTSAEFHGVRIDANHDYTHSGYNLNHGWTLWTLAEHYLFSHDDQWLHSVLPRILRAAAWIVDERKGTMQHGLDGARVPEYGLLPAGELEDNEDWAYWFAVNAYAYRGLSAAAQAVSALDSVQGERLKKEAAGYREDIRKAALRAMEISPVVPLRDGTFVPHVPPRTSLHGRDLGWIRNVLYGAHTLVDCGIFGPDEPLTTWILEDYEDNLFMAQDSLSVPDRDWFSRGGVALQPNLVNLFVSYLERDQLPQALRAFYNDFAISVYPDVNAFTEWVPTLGIGGGPLYKTSDEAAFLIWLRLMLVREDGDRLFLDSGAPRTWLLPGSRIEVNHAATFYGDVSFRIESHLDQGFVEASVTPPRRNPPRAVILRLRHPQGRHIKRVKLNSQNWLQFDPDHETVSLPVKEGSVVVRVFYP